MALTYVSRTFTTVTPNVTVDMLSIVGTGSTEELMLKDTLQAIDVTYLTLVDSTGTGSTLKAKMQAFTLPNGQNAWDQYSDQIRTFSVWGELYINKACCGV